MRILVIGNGGREHAIAWYLTKSAEPVEIFIAPGNAGTDELGINVDIDAADVDALLAYAERSEIDLTIVGPEKPLVKGIVDRFEKRGFAIVGPTAAAARLEGSKAFSKTFMARHGIPTADHRTFEASQLAEAITFVEESGAPIVIKASGLAAGKGAIVCGTVEEARGAIERILRDREFGAAGDVVVVESFMKGEEVSVFALTDGRNYVLLPPIQDHKQVGEGDTGPNTGGMGAYGPAPVMTAELLDRVRAEIIEPTIKGMEEEGHPYRGVLYCGLMITARGPMVVEYNCRLGDPEAQVLLPMLENDPVELFEAIGRRRLGSTLLKHRPGAAACVVLASGGYPGQYQNGMRIDGLDEASETDNVLIFHAGTALDGEGRLVTNGGRVLGVTATGSTLSHALDSAYAAADRIHFDGIQFRRDIGRKGLARSL
jgi:phosphoribosylamine--glycine ligase